VIISAFQLFSFQLSSFESLGPLVPCCDYFSFSAFQPFSLSAFSLSAFQLSAFQLSAFQLSAFQLSSLESSTDSGPANVESGGGAGQGAGNWVRVAADLTDRTMKDEIRPV